MKKIGLSVLLIVSMLTSCEDDYTSNVNTVSLRDISEVQKEDDTALQTYLKTHFYNKQPDLNRFGKVIGLDTIAGENANAQPLWDQVQKKTFKISSTSGEQIEHTMYYIILQEGSGNKATIADIASVMYEGRLINGTVFDRSESITWDKRLDLLGKDSNGKGFKFAVSLLKGSASDATENADGTLTLPTDFGRGIFFMPSALGYFAASYTKIPAYSPLIFTIDLYKSVPADHDNDGILSIDEIKIDDYGVITFPDCNKNGTPDYLDAKKCN